MKAVRNFCGIAFSRRRWHHRRPPLDPQFEELARLLETRLASSLESRLAATLETRLAATLETRLAATLETRLAASLETRLAATLETRLTATLDSRLNERFDSFETRIEQRLQVHYERTSDLVKRAAEGYAATVESIDRRLDRLEKKVDHGFRDHARILKNHERRISALEQKP